MCGVPTGVGAHVFQNALKAILGVVIPGLTQRGISFGCKAVSLWQAVILLIFCLCCKSMLFLERHSCSLIV